MRGFLQTGSSRVGARSGAVSRRRSSNGVANAFISSRVSGFLGRKSINRFQSVCDRNFYATVLTCRVRIMPSAPALTTWSSPAHTTLLAPPRCLYHVDSLISLTNGRCASSAVEPIAGNKTRARERKNPSK